MKTIKSTIFLILFALSASIITSCNKEELFVEPVIEEPVEDDTDTEEEKEEEDTSDEPDRNATEPCTFTLDNVEPNSTIVIDCILDLEGKTINLPENVTIEYDGGDIINGTLNFANNSIIGGPILNSTVTIGGVTPQLKDPTFNFEPKRWGIVEGVVPQAVAFKNYKIINSLVNRVKEMGGSVFSIGEMDAFFDTDHIFFAVIDLPSDFHFKMSDKTHLRVFPVDKRYSSRLFRLFEIENTIISGGFLHGERDQHGPTANGSATLVNITSGKNILVENVHMSDSGTTGLTVNSSKHANDPLYDPSFDVRVIGCTFDSNRRNNLSVTDGKKILVENCNFYRAGITTQFSVGSEPRLGLDVEPDPLQKVDGVIVRGCTESGGGHFSLVAAGGKNIVFENNTVETSIAYNIASGVEIKNNTLTKGADIRAGLKNEAGRNLNRDNIISGNTIIGAIVGMHLTNNYIKVFDNKIIDCQVGMIVNALTDAEIYDNTITYTKQKSAHGITIQDYANNVTFERNTINIENGRAILSDWVNNDSNENDYTVSFKENKLNSSKISIVRGSVGYDFYKNIFNQGIRIDTCRKLKFDANELIGLNAGVIEVSNSELSKDIMISNNILDGCSILTKSVTPTKGNSNLQIINNSIKVYGEWSVCIKADKFDNVSIKGNRLNTERAALVYFRGNGSTISDNINKSSGSRTYNIEGSNNAVSNNN